MVQLVQVAVDGGGVRSLRPACVPPNCGWPTSSKSNGHVNHHNISSATKGVVSKAGMIVTQLKPKDGAAYTSVAASQNEAAKTGSSYLPSTGMK